MITEQDIVVYTVITSYGPDNKLYEMDFYVYNGYGLGEDYDVLMPFIDHGLCGTSQGKETERGGKDF